MDNKTLKELLGEEYAHLADGLREPPPPPTAPVKCGDCLGSRGKFDCLLHETAAGWMDIPRDCADYLSQDIASRPEPPLPAVVKCSTPGVLPRLPGEPIDKYCARLYAEDPSFIPPPVTNMDGSAFTVKGKTAGGLLRVTDAGGREFSMSQEFYNKLTTQGDGK